jgi:hypothetical protein
MNVASLGLASSVAGGTLAQPAAAADRVAQEVADRERAIDSAQRAERSAGIGQTEEDTETSERDADGRLPWEQAPQAGGDAQPPDGTTSASKSRPKDPTGVRGGQLDLLG